MNVMQCWCLSMMHLHRRSDFNQPCRLVICIWLVLDKRLGTMPVNSAAGYIHFLMGEKASLNLIFHRSFYLIGSAFIQSTVTDGVTIGHPTCCIHDCDIPLESVKNRYCPIYRAQDRICVVTTCSNPAEVEYRTCNVKEHRELEDFNVTRNKAMFQLKQQLARLKTSQPRDSIPDTLPTSGPAGIPATTPATFDDEEVVLDKDGICDGKPEEGNKTLRARFGRKRTHNEELCVASCGVILGRATFYGSEAPNGVRVHETLFVY